MGKRKPKRMVASADDEIPAKNYFVVRDLATKMSLIINQDNISTTKKTRLNVGLEIMYQTGHRDRGRAVIVLIGSEEECEALVTKLECESLLIEYGNDTATMKTVNGSSITFGKKGEGSMNVNDVEGSAKRMDDTVGIENYSHVQRMNEKSIDMCDPTLQKNNSDNETNEEENAGTNAMVNKKNGGSDDYTEEETEHNMEEETDDIIEEETDDINTTSIFNEKSFEYIEKNNNDSVIQTMAISSPTNWLDEESTTAADKKGQHYEELSTKRSRTSSENSSHNKRLKSEDDNNCSSAQCIALKEENWKLEKKIEFMKKHYVPRPNPETIDYFTDIVSRCTDDIPRIQNNKKLNNIISMLSLNEEELEQCVDDKSIRQTCRNVVRKVFKAELTDSTVPYSQILLNEPVMKAIREFGRIKHPVESMKFTNGDLNNAMGSVFYQRKRVTQKKKKKSR